MKHNPVNGPKAVRVGFAVLHFKNRDDTRRCVKSILKTAIAGDTLLIIDNSWDFHSTWDCAEGACDVLIVRPRELNPGFARGMNEGIRTLDLDKFDHLVFVNNDTCLPPDFRHKIVDHFGRGGVELAAIGPKLVYMSRPDLVWSAGGHISTIRMTSVQEHIGRSAGDLKGCYETEFISGCVLAIRRDVFEEIGGWPEAYLFGAEEWELSTVLRRQGYRLEINADIVVLHDADLEGGQGASHSFEDLRFVLNSYLNRVVYVNRNFGWAKTALFKMRIAFFLLFIFPLTWKRVGRASHYVEKLKIAFSLMTRVVSRGSHPITWDELQNFAARYD